MRMEDMIMVSVDDHVVEPPHLFTTHAPAKYRDKMPQFKVRDNGTNAWEFEGLELSNIALNAVAGRKKEDYRAEPTGFDQVRKGTWDAKARLGEMNVAGQLAGLNFPSLFGMQGQGLLPVANKELAEIVIQSWNDWHIDDWCATAPGRFIPCAQVPLWDPQLAAKEALRVVKKGCHAITFLPNPFQQCCGTFHDGSWDPLFKVCDENEIVVCLHFADSRAAICSPDTPLNAWITNMQPTLMMNASDLLFSPILRQFKNIRFALSEGSIGWVPYWLERIDQVHGIHSGWTNQHFDGLPSDLFKKHIQVCFIQDNTGIKLRHDIGIGNITWEGDYPHADSVWPNGPEVLWPGVKDLPDDEINKITFENACRWYNFDPFKYEKREESTVGALRAKAKAEGVDLTPLDLQGKGSWARHDDGKPISVRDMMVQMQEMGSMSSKQGKAMADGGKARTEA